jgi:hypothetical protein
MFRAALSVTWLSAHRAVVVFALMAWLVVRAWFKDGVARPSVS